MSRNLQHPDPTACGHASPLLHERGRFSSPRQPIGESCPCYSYSLDVNRKAMLCRPAAAFCRSEPPHGHSNAADGAHRRDGRPAPQGSCARMRAPKRGLPDGVLTERELEVLARLEHWRTRTLPGPFGLSCDGVRYWTRGTFAKPGARGRVDVVRHALGVRNPADTRARSPLGLLRRSDPRGEGAGARPPGCPVALSAYHIGCYHHLTDYWITTVPPLTPAQGGPLLNDNREGAHCARRSLTVDPGAPQRDVREHADGTESTPAGARPSWTRKSPTRSPTP